MSNNKTKKLTKNVPVNNTKRICYHEFLAQHPELDEMRRSGFLIFSGNKEWRYLYEWEKLLNEYFSR